MSSGHESAFVGRPELYRELRDQRCEGCDDELTVEEVAMGYPMCADCWIWTCWE